jgi:List-Bact-rpt repeat protein
MTAGWRISRRGFFILLLLAASIIYHAEATAAQFNLTWTDNSTNEDGFKIKRKAGTNGTYTRVATVGANVTSYTDLDLAAGTTYCYKVLAFNSAAKSAPSNEACVSTGQSSTLAVTTAGSGSGLLSSSPTGITCGSSCAASYARGTTVTLAATPASVPTFTGWGGACSGTGACAVPLTAATSVTAAFTPQLKVKIGVFRPSTGEWYLDLNGNGILDDCQNGGCLAPFGQQGNRPVVGDWAGTGTAQIGVFDPRTGVWKLDRNGNDLWDGCGVDLCLGPFGQSGDLPVVGHWQTTSGADKIGLYRPGKRVWKLDLNNNGELDTCTIDGCLSPFGQFGDLPVVGDWTGSGISRIGVFTPSTGLWKLDLNNNGELDACTIDGCLGPFGLSTDLPVAGDWTGTGKVSVGVFDPGTGLWDLDLNGNGTFDGCQIDGCLGPFGQSGDLPVVGQW